jgi:arginine:ornithine antiporter/lysine permease
LADVKPELKTGIYMYAREGFGRYAGFQISWGYWLSSAFGNVGFGVLLMDTMNYFFPPYFKGGNTWQAVLGASLVFWLMNGLVLRGVKSAAALNVVGTVAKFIPILVFIAVTAIATRAGIWHGAFWGNVASHVTGSVPPGSVPLGSMLAQVKSTMLVTLWVYIGIEGAVVMSDKSNPKTVGRATLIGFLATTLLYVLVSVLPFGLQSQAQLSVLAPPSMAAIMGATVGPWGTYLINTGVVVSILSSWLVWTLLVAEVPWAAAKDGSYPKIFTVTNRNGTASVALWVSTAIMQAMMILVYFSDNAWNVMLSITGVMILPAYIGATFYLWQLVATGHYPAAAQIGRTQALVCSVVASLYGVWLIYAGGLAYMLCGMVFFALGNLVFIWSRREHAPQEAPFRTIELVVAAAMTVLAFVALWMLFSGQLKQVYAP